MSETTGPRHASASVPHWSTTCFGDSADTKATELSALGEHVSLCRAAAAGPLAALQRGALLVHDVVATRFVTTLVIVAALFSALLLAF